MATYAELKSNVSKELGLDETPGGTEDVLVGRRLNQGARKFLLATHCNVNKATDTIDTAGQDQDLGAQAMAVLDISIVGTGNTTIWQPEKTTLAEIIRFARATSATSGSARYYAHAGSLWSFYPALAANDVVTLYYVPRPTEMSSGTHDPSTETYGAIPVEYHDALEYYALWRMGSYDDDGSSKMGQDYRAMWYAEVAECRRAQRRKGGRRLGKVPMARRGMLRTSMSQDLW